MNTEGSRTSQLLTGMGASEERVLLVSLDTGKRDSSALELQEELEVLLETLGKKTLRKLVQHRDREDPATFIGKGKADELKKISKEAGARLVVFDTSLTPVQAKNLSESSGCIVWDRPRVIMEVFRKRARSSEAKLQVELALCRYEIPHLRGLGLQMSRTGAGIATRGPGETEYERHRRKLERRIRSIEKKLEGIRGRRENQRKRRNRSGLPLFSLVGYTNAGKSSLFKALSGDSFVLSKDQLFTTLDTTVRAFCLPHFGSALITDTVGFIRNLPPDLIAAFRATLEEIREADALVWVVDATKIGDETVLVSVEEILKDLGVWEMPRIIALNKIDLVGREVAEKFLRSYRRQGESVIPTCALTGEGLPELMIEMERVVSEGKLSKVKR